jgi:hypothetical protein
MTTARETPELIETAIRRVVEELPSLRNLKLTIGLELRARGDVQLYLIELPGPTITKGFGHDARVYIALARAHFNELATEGHLADWRDAFERGHAKASGPPEVLRLIGTVAARQEERMRTRKARSERASKR